MPTTLKLQKKPPTIADELMKRLPPLFLSLLSGLLLYASWPMSPLTLLIFVAFVPLLVLEQQGIDRGRFFVWTYITLLLWNIGTTWWVCEASIPGGLLAIILNPLLMCIPWIGFYNIKRRMGAAAGYTSLMAFWLCFEYIHLNWQLSWPWLTLGNVFATHPGWVQWYEFTGVAGGSCWILLVNLFLFGFLKKVISAPQSAKRNTLLLLVTIVLPFVISFFLGLHLPAWNQKNRPENNIVIVQPNIDPYDKFAAGKEESELRKLIQLSESQIDSNTALVVWPETAIPVSINEDSMKTSSILNPVRSFLRQYPKLNLLTGIEGFRFFSDQNKGSYSTKIPGTDSFSDEYNSAVLMDSNQFQIYHKSKLVPGVETIPSYFRFLEPIFEKFGGATGSYAIQEDRTVLRDYLGNYSIAPAVCYESIYGEFMSKYVRNGANLIAIITNDGWWGNTPGYKQHENYARLRAIENRRYVVHCANTGISSFIDPFGNIYYPQSWDQAVATKMYIPPRTQITFYTRAGDLIYKGAFIVSLGLLVWNLVLIIKQRMRTD